LTVTARHPVTVAGRGFHPGERVRVVLYLDRTRAANATASARGRFVVRYSATLDRCAAIRVVARGNRGSVASFALAPQCAPARPQPQSDDALFPYDPQPKR
jgi:hypothetical protein